MAMPRSGTCINVVLVNLAALAVACAPPPPEAQLRLASSSVLAEQAEPGDLFAEQVTRTNASRSLVGGLHAIGGLDDWALGNGLICAVVSDPGHEAILTSTGGLLVDLGHCDRGDDQFPILHLHMLNLSRDHIAPFETVRAERDDEEARLVARGELDGIGIETVYAVGVRNPRVLRVTSRLRRTGPGLRLSMVGSATLHGRRSLAPFSLSTRVPEMSLGFDHPDSDPSILSSIVEAIHPADLHVLVGSEDSDEVPGISYGQLVESARLIDAEGNGRALSLLALNGEHFTLQGVFTRPLWTGGWRGIGFLEFAQTPLMNLRTGETLEIRMALVVGERADAASVTDRFFPGAPSVSGRVDDPSARLHVTTEIDGDPAPFTMVAPESDGRFVFRAPRGDYILSVRGPGGVERTRTFRVESGPVDLGPVETGAPAVLRLPRGRPMRLVFLGEGGTSDPRIGDDWLDFRVGGLRFANSGSSREVALAGVERDPREIRLAPGRYRVIAARGPEFDVATAEIELAAGRTHDLEIGDPVRVFETPGWIGADLHVHAGPSFDSTLSLEERVRTFAAQEGEVVVATEHDVVVDYAPTIRALGLADRLASVVGSEVTGTATTAEAPNTIGHSNVFPIEPDPLAYRRGALRAEGRRLRDIARQVRELGPEALLQLNHPRLPEEQAAAEDEGSYFTHLGTGVATFRPDRPFDQAPNSALIEPDPETGLRDLDFDLIELMNGPSRLYYRRVRADWLSATLQGEFRTGTANSDSHDARTPVALPRNWVRVPDDRVPAFDRSVFLGAVREGHVVGSTAPWLDVAIEGAGPGDTFIGGEGTLRVAVRSAPWAPVSELRVRVNAELVYTAETGNGAEHAVPLEFDRDAFVFVEVEGEPGEVFEALLPGAVPLAYANPVFVDADADGHWQAPGLPDDVPDVIDDPEDTR